MQSTSSEVSSTRFDFPIALLSVDEQGHVVEANDRWCEQTGLNADESLGEGWMAAVAKEDLERVHDEWTHAVESLSPLHLEFTLRGRDEHARARYAFLELRPQPARTSSDSRIAFLATLHEISRIKHENALQKGQSRLMQLIAAGAELEKTLSILTLLIEDALPKTHCSILLLNARRTHLRYGAAPSLPPEYVEATGHIAIAPDAGGCGRAACIGERVISEDIQNDPRWEAFRHLAETHGFRACWSQPLFSSDGKTLGTFAMYYDEPRAPNEEEIAIIELAAQLAEVAIKSSRSETQLRAEKNAAQLASQRKTSFLARVSHDMRTPMNTVLGMVDLALSGDLSDEHREYLTTARHSGVAILELLNDVIDLAKIEAGKTPLEVTTVTVEEFVFDSLSGLAFAAHQKGLEMVVDIDENVPEKLEGDPAKLRQILVNLVGNAVKFTDHGEICVTIENEAEEAEEAEEDDEVTLKVTVSDTGIGIQKELHAHIFDSFVQAEGGASKQFAGSGLGLAISARLVRMMNGQIWLKSEVGKGSSFHFNAKLRRLAPPVERTPFDTENGRVLLACLNDSLRRSLSRRFQSWSLRSTTAVGADAALTELDSANRKGAPYELLILDRDLDSPIKIRRILSEARSNPNFQTHVVLLESILAKASGDAFPNVASVGKPVLASELDRAIRISLGGRDAARERKSKSDSTARRKSASRSAFESELQKSLQVLLVDDNDDNRALAVRVLKKRGHEVICARNGKEAIECLAIHDIDIALMDLHMPVMDGLEATAQIRAAEEASGGHLPIVAMTANAMRSQEQECLDAGMDAYISKPFDFADLFRIVESLGEG